MQFYEAHYLKFLLLLPLLLVLGSLSSQLWRRRLQKLGDIPVITEKLIPGHRRAAAGLQIFFLLLVFMCLILALARPQWGESAKKVERKGVDILFLLDTSLSMLAEDIKPNRFETAKQGIKSILRKLKGDRVGLVVFSGSAYLQTPLTLDYSAFLLFLESVKVGHVPDPGSSLSSALDFVLRLFPKEDLKYKVLILMTEGESTLGGIEESLKALKDAHIRVYTLGMGTEAGGPIPLKDQTGRQLGFKKDRNGSVVISRMDPAALQMIAQETGGIFLPSTTAGREVDLLLKHISSLGQKSINEKKITEKEDHYGFFLLWALIFLLLELFVRRSQRIPPAFMMLAVWILFSGFIESPRTLNNQGNENFSEKKYQSAIEDYRKAKVKAPDDSAIRYNLGTALYQTDQYKDARQEFQKAVDLSRQEPELQAKSYYNLGNTEYRLGNFEGAIKNYKEALKLNPKDTDAKSNLEFVQSKKSLFDKKNEDRKKDSPQQNEQQNKQQQDQQQQNQQNQDKQDQNPQQDQKNQDKQDQSPQQDQKNQDQQNQQDQSQQNQQEGGEGEGSSGQQDPKSQPEDSQGQPEDSQDQSGKEQNPEQEPNKDSQDQKKEQEKPGQQGEKSPQQEPQKPDAGETKPEQQQQEQKDQEGDQGEKEQPSEQDDQEGQEQEQQPEPGHQQQDQQQESEPDPSEELQGQEDEESLQQPSQEQGLEEQEGQESEPEANEGQDSAEKGQEKGNSGGAGTQYQGQMSLESALKILDALHEGEKEFSDLRRPPVHRKSVSVEKDW